MRGEKRNVRHYAKILAKKHGLPVTVVHDTLMRMTQRMCSMIARGEEIRIKGFGRIYYDKRQQR